MPRQRDLHGLVLSTESAAAAEAFDRTVLAYLRFRTDVAVHLRATLAADPGFALAHCLKGCFAMLSQKRANLGAAADAERAAAGLGALDTPREQAHVAALGAWIAGDLDRALAIWEHILAEHPTDVLALRLTHFNCFWLGRPQRMLQSIGTAWGHWHEELPAYGLAMSCHAFSLEECGDYARAEHAGRRAVEIEPADLWGVHAVAHVLQTQHRLDETITWLDAAEAVFSGANNIVHHLDWHRALCHLERGQLDAVMLLYDRRIRNLESPLVMAQPDFYLDIMNAASLLWLLEAKGVDVGQRWDEIADQAEARLGDCQSTFALPHLMMALAATGRHGAAERMLQALQICGDDGMATARIVRSIAAPVCEAVWMYRRGEYKLVGKLMQPVHTELHELGGSHVQQRVLQRLLVDANARCKRDSDDFGRA
jgi:tetratricopeptide (TPR) repeat protein